VSDAVRGFGGSSGSCAMLLLLKAAAFPLFVNCPGKTEEVGYSAVPFFHIIKKCPQLSNK
jgi:hypothetical protein